MPQYSLYGLLGGGGGGVTFPLLAPGGSALSPSYSFAGNTNTGMWSSGLDVLNFSTTGVERMRIRSDGYVTIGGTGAAAKFNVYGATGVLGNGVNLWETSTGTNKRLYIYQDTDRVVYDATFSTGGNAHAFNTGSTERMQITNAGQVLVGTNAARTAFLGGSFTPRLQLEGLDNSPSTFSLVNNFNGLAQTWGIIFGRARSGTNGGFGLVSDDDSLGALYFAGSTSAALRSAAQIRASVDGTPSDTAMPGKLQFYTVPAGSLTLTERMRIASTGNVGIGTTTISSRLHLASDTNTTELIDSYNNANANGAALLFRSARGTSAAPTASQSGDELGWVGAYGYGASAFSSGSRASMSMIAAENWTATAQGTDLRFKTTTTGGTSPADRFVISSGGQALFATTSFLTPRSNFLTTVSPQVQIEGLSNSQSSLSITDSQNANSTAWGIYFGKSRAAVRGGNTIVNSGDYAGSIIATGNNGTTMVNCGIIQFNIEGTPSATSMPGRITFLTVPDGSTTALERMRITNAGNVGIGTASPGEKLEVSGNIKATSGDVSIATAGKGLKVAEGANAKMGTAVLVAGTVTVSTTAVTANSRIFLTAQVLGTVADPKALAVTARVNGTSFTITSSDNTDTSTVAWMMVEPA